MKKLFVLVVSLLAICLPALADDPLSHSAPDSTKKASGWYIALDAGPMYNEYENAFTYRDNGKSLFSYQVALSGGYDFNEAFGVRVQVEGGKNLAANNFYQTSDGGFWPYEFYNVSGFADGVLDLVGLRNKENPFRPKLYGGVGLAHTFGFNYLTQTKHPWQWDMVSKSNTVFGFRLGAIAEYDFDFGLGIYADLRGEAYTDQFNGLMPSKEDFDNFEGYPGFPFDLRAMLSLGLIYKF